MSSLQPLPETEHPTVRYIWNLLRAKFDAAVASLVADAVQAGISSGVNTAIAGLKVPAVGLATIPALGVGLSSDLVFTWNTPLPSASYQYAAIIQPPVASTVASFAVKSKTAAALTLSSTALVTIAAPAPVVALGWPT